MHNQLDIRFRPHAILVWSAFAAVAEEGNRTSAILIGIRQVNCWCTCRCTHRREDVASAPAGRGRHADDVSPRTIRSPATSAAADNVPRSECCSRVAHLQHTQDCARCKIQDCKIQHIVRFCLCGKVAEQLVWWTCSQQVAGSNPGHHGVKCNPGQVVYTYASITKQYNWYQPMDGDDLRMKSNQEPGES